MGRSEVVKGMERSGINDPSALGLTTPEIRAIAKRYRRDQPLAEELWESGVHEARILASFVADPASISRSTMDKWATDFTTWNVCDSCCFGLFDRTPFAWEKVAKWAQDEREFVRRAAFSIIAGVAVHDKSASDQVFLNAFATIEKYA